jgi:aryl-alcohol dehydrogenase-like predicted oxidoreductase
VNKIEYFRYLEGIGKISEEIGISMSQLAIAWILKNPVVTAPIIGASTVEQVEENCRILEVKIDDRDYLELNDLTKTCEASLY